MNLYDLMYMKMCYMTRFQQDLIKNSAILQVGDFI